MEEDASEGRWRPRSGDPSLRVETRVGFNPSRVQTFLMFGGDQTSGAGSKHSHVSWKAFSNDVAWGGLVPSAIAPKVFVVVPAMFTARRESRGIGIMIIGRTERRAVKHRSA